MTDEKLQSPFVRGTGRAIGIQITGTEFNRVLAELRVDVDIAFLCAFRAALVQYQRRGAFRLLQAETPLFAQALSSYMAADITAAAEEAFRPIPRDLPPKLKTPITLSEDPAFLETALAVAEMLRLVNEETQGSAHSAEIEAERARIAALAEDNGVTLSSFYNSGTLYRAIARGVDAAERRLMPKMPQVTFEIETKTGQAREEFLVWFRLVRACVAVSVLDAIPYQTVWGQTFTRQCGRTRVYEPEGIYGDAGYWLASQIFEMAASLRMLPEYQGLGAAANDHPWLVTYASFSSSASDASQYPLAQKVDSLAFDPLVWRDHCKLVGCPIPAQGQLYPFEFPPIDPDVVNDESLSGVQDHMYARVPAQRMIRRARYHWDYYRTQVKPELKVAGATEKQIAADGFKQLDLRLTAGTLRFGGAHPPHGAHRNGAMFDVVVRAVLPLHCPGQQEISEEDDVRQAMSDSQGAGGGTRTIPVRIEGASGAPAAPASAAAPTLFWNGPYASTEYFIRSRCKQWDYPKRRFTWKKDGSGEIAIEELGVRITQCFLLTFPSQIILADWRTLRDATNRLIIRMGELAERQTDDEGKRAVAHIIKWLGEPAVAAAPDGPWRGRLSLLPGHHHHWHVSYPPAELEAPSDDREPALAWIDDHIGEILAD